MYIISKAHVNFIAVEKQMIHLNESGMYLEAEQWDQFMAQWNDEEKQYIHIWKLETKKY